MPVIDFDPSKANKTTSRFLVYYLEKENQNLEEKDKTPFFDQDKNIYDPEEIINEIDNNDAKLGKNEDRYYSIYVSPSETELVHINNDPEKLKNYTRQLMNEYAKNFKKGYTSNDLLYFAKIEHTRTYGFKDPEVINNFVEKGSLKAGHQMHVHIVVSRKTKSKWYKGQRIIDSDGQVLVDDPDLIKRANTAKISPMEPSKGGVYKIGSKKTGVRTTWRGFNRTQFKQIGEERFDKMFFYKRPLKERFEYVNLKKNHPKEFLKKYGKQPLLIKNVTAKDANTKQQKLKYVLQTVENKLPNYAEAPKEMFHQVLKEKGISETENHLTFKGEQFSKKELGSQFAKNINTLFAAYYFGKRFWDEQKERENKDKNQDHDRDNYKHR